MACVESMPTPHTRSSTLVVDHLLQSGRGGLNAAGAGAIPDGPEEHDDDTEHLSRPAVRCAECRVPTRNMPPENSSTDCSKDAVLR